MLGSWGCDPMRVRSMIDDDDLRVPPIAARQRCMPMRAAAARESGCRSDDISVERVRSRRSTSRLGPSARPRFLGRRWGPRASAASLSRRPRHSVPHVA